MAMLALAIGPISAVSNSIWRSIDTGTCPLVAAITSVTPITPTRLSSMHAANTAIHERGSTATPGPPMAWNTATPTADLR